jgi:hypothetical protein
MVSLLYKSWTESKIQVYIIFGVVFFISAIVGFLAQSINDTNFLAGIFAGICIAMALRAFKFHDNRDRQHYLLIPASNGEKLITTLVEVHLIQPILCILTMSVGLFLGVFVSNITGWNTFEISALTTVGGFLSNICSIDFILGLILMQAIFVFGNLYFKRRAWLKTMLSILVFAIVLSIIDLIFVKYTFYPSADNHGMVLISPNFSMSIDLNIHCLSILISSAIIAVFWVMSFFRLRETEV